MRIWLASRDPQDFNGALRFKSEEEAVLQAPEELDLLPGEPFYVGIYERPEVPTVDGAWVRSVMMNGAGNRYGAAADGWLEEIDAAEIEALEEYVNEAVLRFLLEYRLMPDWTSVRDINIYRVPVESCG